jgi:hypothetical protein
MPTFSGKYQYANPNGSGIQAGPCRVTFEGEVFTLTPGSSAPLAFDLGGIDAFTPGDYELTLTLYTGKKIILSQFGKTFQNLSHDLLEAYRKRLVQCLLLEDLEEITRFDGFVRLDRAAADLGRAEFRLYKSNLAVLPTGATGFQWRLADIDAVNFDGQNYAVTLESAGRRMSVTKLAKRTSEFKERLEESIAQLNEKGARTLHKLFPFLNPDQFQSAAELMKEGRAAPLAKLKAIHPKTEQALLAKVVDEKLKPYFDSLMQHSQSGWIYSGFKLLREEGKEAGAEGGAQEKDGAASEDADTSENSSTALADESGLKPPSEDGGEEKEEPILNWFFFPLAASSGAKFPGNLVAWEATSRSGRATYFFRLGPPEDGRRLTDPTQSAAYLDGALRDLNRAIVLLNFRREPIYLPDESLEIQPRFLRYAIACRKIPELRRLRASFLGRALHTSPEAWQKQFLEFLKQI